MELSIEHSMMLAVLAIVGCMAIGIILVGVIKSQIDYISFLRKNNKKVAEEDRKRLAMIASGDHHEWVKVVYENQEVLACRKTGWCPDLKVYFKVAFVKEWEERHKTNEDLARYRDRKVEALAEEYGMLVSDFEKLMEKIFSIKKDFFLEKMKNGKKDKV